MLYSEIKMALQVFDLGERCTIAQIKKRYRELVKKHHPDTGEQPDDKTIVQINTAHEILMSYCADYQFNFSEKEFLRQCPEERFKRQFWT
ncbi:MAG: molecular chaperone DnaJ [Desulfobacterales bacterium]|nr:MAG: molecular chaperone DnaJ [Desulfobacterales bacterium]